MKKKLLIKETDLNNLIPKLIEDVIKEGQLEIDFGVDPKDEALLSLMEERYQEISNEIKNELDFIRSSGWNDTVYDSLESIHSDKIFPLWRELDSTDRSNQSLSEIVERFNELEEVLVTCLETYKEWKILNQEFNNSTEELTKLVN